MAEDSDRDTARDSGSMFKRYISELAKHAAHVFTLAGILIALVWFIPPLLDRIGREVTFPSTWLDQALLSALAAVIAIMVGSYLAWRDVTRKLDEYQKATKETTPIVTLEPGQFAGHYSSPVESSHRLQIPIRSIQNRGSSLLYLEPPIVYKWGLPRPIGSPGPLTLYSRDEKNVRSQVERAALEPQDLTFGLEIEIRVQLEVATLEELASLLKELRQNGGVTLRFTFSPELGEAVDKETFVDFDPFCSQVLNWWEQQKRTDLLRIYGDS